ncbi:hypothetical protein AB0F17_17035 [Nonomuraea sp. NPDC026600]|uniref:hypothetical protein n=1 Tax=Nonomuraea sp. NPDC026600 TaxID=3155363 RepID=UPI0033F8E101
MARFQCSDCNRTHHTATTCPACGPMAFQVQLCHTHAAGFTRRCGVCRMLARSQSAA